jgi:type IV secretory pathway TraG/TraD family ATPase VirD4
MSYRRSDLDTIIGHWSKTDPITVRQMCQNTMILGKTGSGKSSGSGDFLLRRLVSYNNSGGLILAAKPEDKQYFLRVFREERRLDDLLILEPGGEYRFNILDYELKRGSDTRQLTQMLLLLGETLERAEAGGHGGGDGFFKAKSREGLDHAIEIVTRATGGLDPYALQCFISGAAMSLAELDDPQWQQSYHSQALLKAEQNCTTDLQRHDCQAAALNWRSTWPRLNDRTRTSIEAGMVSPLHVLNLGTIRDLLATSTSLTPEDMENRKWILANMPITPGDATATVFNAAVKLAFQRYILSRQAADGDPLLCIWSDEFQNAANSFDRAYVEACRSHKACLVALTQSTHALYTRIFGHGQEHEADALLTNFGQVIIHTLGDYKTAKYFSELLGERREIFISPSTAADQDDLYESIIWGKSRMSVSATESYQPVLQPAAFLSGGLRSGGSPDNTVDGIVIRTGQRFNASGENYLLAGFRQR